jgi:hypothetical protein
LTGRVSTGFNGGTSTGLTGRVSTGFTGGTSTGLTEEFQTVLLEELRQFDRTITGTLFFSSLKGII